MNRFCMLASISLVAAVTAAPAPAHAALGSFSVRAFVAPNGGATAVLSDTIIPSDRYLLTLTATGGGTCGLTGPVVEIADADVQGFANPVSAAVAGACTLYNASVVYTVTWTGNPGPSGQFPIYCTWVQGTQTCSPTDATIAA
jgi:hypothetical protein